MKIEANKSVSQAMTEKVEEALIINYKIAQMGSIG